jgi:hypothetical protein
MFHVGWMLDLTTFGGCWQVFSDESPQIAKQVLRIPSICGFRTFICGFQKIMVTLFQYLPPALIRPRPAAPTIRVHPAAPTRPRPAPLTVRINLTAPTVRVHPAVLTS